MQEARNAILHASQSYTMLMCLNDLITCSVSIQSINHAYSCADGSVYKVNHGGGIAPEQKHEASISISSSKLPMTFINVSDSYPSGLSGASYPTTVISTTKEVLVTAN